MKAVLAGLKAGLVRPDEMLSLPEPSESVDSGTPLRVEIKEMRMFQKPDKSSAGISKAASSEVLMITNAYVEFTSRLHALACQRLLHHNPAYSHHSAGGSGAAEVL